MQTSPGAAEGLVSTGTRVATGAGLGGDVGVGGAAIALLGAGGGIVRSLG